MGGFVVECLLKALLLERYRNLQHRVDPATLSAADREIYTLLYTHDLEAMMEYFPELEMKLNAGADLAGKKLLPRFKAICAEWTIYARYSPRSATMPDAARFLNTIAEVKEWLKEL
jgi:hypothetical protein